MHMMRICLVSAIKLRPTTRQLAVKLRQSWPTITQFINNPTYRRKQTQRHTVPTEEEKLCRVELCGREGWGISLMENRAEPTAAHQCGTPLPVLLPRDIASDTTVPLFSFHTHTENTFFHYWFEIPDSLKYYKVLLITGCEMLNLLKAGDAAIHLVTHTH